MLHFICLFGSFQAFFEQFAEAPVDLVELDDGASDPAHPPPPSPVIAPNIANNPNHPYSGRLPVSYFRMGGGDGKERSGFMYHSGVWLECSQWPPLGVHDRVLFFHRQKLRSRLCSPNTETKPKPAVPPAGKVSQQEYISWLPPLLEDFSFLKTKKELAPPAHEVIYDSKSCSSFQYDPRQVCP